MRCLDSSLQRSDDSMARLIGSQFDAGLVVRAYDGLCANISGIVNVDGSLQYCRNYQLTLSEKKKESKSLEEAVKSWSYNKF